MNCRRHNRRLEALRIRRVQASNSRWQTGHPHCACDPDVQQIFKGLIPASGRKANWNLCSGWKSQTCNLSGCCRTISSYAHWIDTSGSLGIFSNLNVNKFRTAESSAGDDDALSVGWSSTPQTRALSVVFSPDSLGSSRDPKRLTSTDCSTVAVRSGGVVRVHGVKKFHQRLGWLSRFPELLRGLVLI